MPSCISIISAMEAHGGIGYKGALPWPHECSDLRFFKNETLGKTVVMGRKTWESLGEKPLKDRKNIVLSRKIKPGERNGVRFIADPKDIMTEDGPVYIIGGVETYRAYAGMADYMKITHIVGHYKSDTFFPQDVLDSYGWERTGCSFDHIGNRHFKYKRPKAN